MNIKSRILEFLPKDLIIELNSICYDVLISDNNTKVNKMVAALDKYDVDYSELGPGTNRFAILIDGYVFKIAMDKDGVRDNLAEFSLSQELQPFVIKVYECNGLIIVTEYVTVISKEEFINNKDEIRHTLSFLAQGYLLGDVGSVTKNFMNWGFRDDGSLVILDFAYIYRVLGEEMICSGLNSDGSLCTEILEYDSDFNKLICPRCRKTYTFHDIRRKISRDYERKELAAIKQIAYKVTKPNQEFNSDKTNTEINDGGNVTMSNYNNENNVNIDANESYLAALEFLKNNKSCENRSDDEAIIEESDNDTMIMTTDVFEASADTNAIDYDDTDDSDDEYEESDDDITVVYDDIDDSDDDEYEESDDDNDEEYSDYDDEYEESNDANDEYSDYVETPEDDSVVADYEETDNDDACEAMNPNNYAFVSNTSVNEKKHEELNAEVVSKPQSVEIKSDDVIILTTTDADIDEMRRSLIVNTRIEPEFHEDEQADKLYSDYEDLYDDADKENQNYKMNRRKNNWGE